MNKYDSEIDKHLRSDAWMETGDGSLAATLEGEKACHSFSWRDLIWTHGYLKTRHTENCQIYMI